MATESTNKKKIGETTYRQVRDKVERYAESVDALTGGKADRTAAEAAAHMVTDMGVPESAAFLALAVSLCGEELDEFRALVKS